MNQYREHLASALAGVWLHIIVVINAVSYLQRYVGGLGRLLEVKTT